MPNIKEILKDKTVLITGGTGFLGKALIKELLKYDLKSIRVFSRDEFKHHLIYEQFKSFKDEWGNPKIRNLIGDVRDYERLKKATKNCDIVIHAAALKRIDILEYNVEEAVKTNILGTLNVVRASVENNVEKVVFISTDKACSPVNGYGACKFVSERIITESNFNKGSAKTILNCVRYGNVINSTGSVIPFFIEKIMNNEEIPLTDPEMTRFLITSNQAVDLIFNALVYGKGGEIFIPKAHSFKIIDLVQYLIKKYGTNNKIRVIGIRPGEKLHELMINDVEAKRTYGSKNLFVIKSQIEKYQPHLKKNSLKEFKKIDFAEYNSKEDVLQGERLEEYFKKIGI
jgi:UDP-N-acetylglucosamine 4,6-dehydratase/5-epimerase